MAMNKRSRAATESLTLLLITAGVLVLVNVLGQYWYGRLDLTATRRFSLSSGSRRIAKNLEDKMTIKAYFTKDLPPPFNTTERYVRDILSEYQAASDGKIQAEFIHPDTDATQKEAEDDGIEKIRHQVISGDSLSAKDGYQGLVIKYLGDKKVIPAIDDTKGLEYEITTDMKELVGQKRSIGVISDHGAATPTKGLTKLQKLLPGYTLTSVSASKPIDAKLPALLVVGPTEPFSDEELLNIDQYVMHGRSLGVFGGTEKINLTSLAELSASDADSHMNELLEKWGLKVRSDIVADAQCQNMPLRGMLGFRVMVPYPPLPLVTFDDAQRENPVLFRLNGSIFPFTSSIKVEDPPNKHVKVKALATTSKQSWRMTGSNIDLKVRMPQEWSSTGPVGPSVVLASIEGKLPSAFAEDAAMSSPDSKKLEPTILRAKKNARVLVFGAGSVLRDQFIPSPEQMKQRSMSSGVAIVLNAIDWLAQDSDLIAIRAKNVEESPLEVPKAVAQAQAQVKQASQAAQKAALQGNQQAANAAAGQAKDALARGKEALEAWGRKKKAYRYGNMLGIPFFFALFGLMRWGLRRNKKERLAA